MGKFIIIAIMALIISNPVQAKEEVKEFHSGVEIIWGEEIHEQSDKIKVEEVRFFDRLEMIRVIKNELQKYPKGLLGKFIKKIYISRGATVEGEKVGGVATGKHGTGGVIYRARWYDDKKAIIHRLHHEIAHHIMFYAYNSKPILAAWQKLNPEGFEYLGSGLEAIKTGDAYRQPTLELYQAGFITPYAASSIAEDFAEISAYIFAGDKDFWQMADKFERISHKVDLTLMIYQSIDKKYNRQYVRYRF